MNAPQLTLKDFANEICLRAKEYDVELLGTGYQKISSDRMCEFTIIIPS